MPAKNLSLRLAQGAALLLLAGFAQSSTAGVTEGNILASNKSGGFGGGGATDVKPLGDMQIQPPLATQNPSLVAGSKSRTSEA